MSIGSVSLAQATDRPLQIRLPSSRQGAAPEGSPGEEATESAQEKRLEGAESSAGARLNILA